MIFIVVGVGFILLSAVLAVASWALKAVIKLHVEKIELEFSRFGDKFGNLARAILTLSKAMESHITAEDKIHGKMEQELEKIRESHEKLLDKVGE